MDWDNITGILSEYSQRKHFVKLFEKIKLSTKGTKTDMIKTLYEACTHENLYGPQVSQEAFDNWLALHQIDGNNYCFVYKLRTRPSGDILRNLFINREHLLKARLWEINPNNESEELDTVMPELNGVKLIGIHRNDILGTYTFSFVAPSEITGKRADGSTRIFKKMFFGHCVLFDSTDDCKIIFNPTVNLLHVNGVHKSRNDWTPIAYMFFTVLRELIGHHEIIAPEWIPQALSKFADEATDHKNPVIYDYLETMAEKVSDFAVNILTDAGIDILKDQALVTRLAEDIQQSLEAQLMEKYDVIREMDSFLVFKQRSDGMTHIISVETKEAGFRSGVATQTARRSRVDGEIDLLGVLFKVDEMIYRLIIEKGRDAYLIRGLNAFIEEEVANFVIRKLNEYYDQIQSAAFSPR